MYNQWIVSSKNDQTLLFFCSSMILYCKYTVFGFWSDKTSYWIHQLGLREIVFLFCFSLPAADAVCTGPGDSSSCVSPWLWSWWRWWSTENTADSHAGLHHNHMTICLVISYNIIAGTDRYNCTHQSPSTVVVVSETLAVRLTASHHVWTMHMNGSLQDCRGTATGSDLISAEVDLISVPTMTCSIFNISMLMLSDTTRATWSCNTGVVYTLNICVVLAGKEMTAAARTYEASWCFG